MAGLAGEQRARRAAVVNGLLVFCVPVVLMLLSLVTAFRRPWPDEMSAFRPSTSRVALEFIRVTLAIVALAAVAAWRTWVHAVRWQAGQGRGWQGVAEASACGLLVALLYLSPGIVTRPAEAPPYVIVYGGAAAVLGCVAGLVLRTTATVVLRVSKSAAA
jgi:hypothetical protein